MLFKVVVAFHYMDKLLLFSVSSFSSENRSGTLGKRPESVRKLGNGHAWKYRIKLRRHH